MTKLNQHSAVAGRFQIEKHTVDESGAEVPGSRHVASPWTNNLITNSGLDNMHAAGFMARCMVGAGNTAPANGDTQLESQLAVVNGSVGQGPNSTVEGYNSIVGTYVFGQGVGTGIIAELGVAPATGNITTRALIKDEGGSPTTIVKGPSDVLTVTYQLREYPSQIDTVSTLVNPHTEVSYTVTQRTFGGLQPNRLRLWHSEGAIGTRSQRYTFLDVGALEPWDGGGSLPSSGSESETSFVASPYTPGNYYRDAVLTWNEGAGNVPGANRLRLGRDANNALNQPFFLQASFDPPIDKDNSKTLIITLRKSWGRYEP